MGISGVILIEDGNTNNIHLYKEGSFWKAYERSAYLFVHHIKPYRTKLRYYKNIEREVISIGFPDSALSGLVKDCKIIYRTETSLSIEFETGQIDAVEKLIIRDYGTVLRIADL
jgi:hypothetical protein